MNNIKKLALEEHDSEWCFKESARQRGCYAKLDAAEDLMDEGELDRAMTILESLAEKFPDCLEVYNDIYLCHFYNGQYQRAFKYLNGVVHNIVSALPENFLSTPNQKLFWGFLENRPFLRLYLNLANAYLDKSDFKTAMGMFQQLLQWNPNDNQGVRERALICYFELGLLDEVVTLCDAYPDDMLAGVVYARPLVLFLRKKLVEASQCLSAVTQRLPNVAKELIKSRHTMPSSMREGYLTVGGEDEAYQYWLDFGKYWKRASGAIAFVKQNLKLSQDNVVQLFPG